MIQRKKSGRKKKNIRKTIIRVQIAALTGAVFLLLMIGAAVLTKVVQNNKEQLQNSSEMVQEQQKDGEKKENPEKSEKEFQEEPQELQPVQTKKITVSAIGDCVIGTDCNFDKNTNFDAFYMVKKNPGYFFEKVAPVLSKDDLTIANMEGTLTESNERAVKQFAFRGKPEYTSVLNAGSIEAMNLANNHSKDYGETGYEDTIRYLEEAGIVTFGYDRTAIMKIHGISVGLVGIYELAEGMGKMDQVKELTEQIRQQGAQLVIVSFHWGTEKANNPDDTQKALAHAAIDSGADLVLGHHPHVLQGIETYKGKKIVYSLGNFCFGGNKNPRDKDTLIYQQTFTFEGENLVEDENVTLIPCLISSVNEYNNYQPVLAQEQDEERILQRVQEYSEGLS